MNSSYPIYKYFLSDDLPLPSVIINIIYDFIRPQERVTLNRANYITYHTCLIFPARNLESFIRKVVRRDVTLVFGFHLLKNIDRWVKVMRNYRYSSMIYPNYLKFLDAYCVIHDSNNCRSAIHDMVLKHNLGNNWHKNNRIRNIKWSN